MKTMRIVLADDAPEKIGVVARDGTHQLLVKVPASLDDAVEQGFADIQINDSGVLIVREDMKLKYAFAPGAWLAVGPHAG